MPPPPHPHPPQALTSKAMRPRHWAEIMRISGHELVLAEDVFKLQHLLDCKLLEHRDDVEELTSAWGGMCGCGSGRGGVGWGVGACGAEAEVVEGRWVKGWQHAAPTPSNGL